MRISLRLLITERLNKMCSTLKIIRILKTILLCKVVIKTCYGNNLYKKRLISNFSHVVRITTTIINIL